VGLWGEGKWGKSEKTSSWNAICRAREKVEAETCTEGAKSGGINGIKENRKKRTNRNGLQTAGR